MKKNPPLRLELKGKADRRESNVGDDYAGHKAGEWPWFFSRRAGDEGSLVTREGAQWRLSGGERGC